MKPIPIVFLISLLLLLTSCGGGGTTTGENGNYDQTKKMVTDILKTEDGQKAITEVLKDEEMQKKIVIESDTVKKSIEETLTGDKGKEFWTKMFEDPKFVESFAKSMQDKQEDVMKQLMSDSEFQKKMIELMQNPEMEDQLLSVLKGQQFREHLEKTIEETMNTPMFKAKVSDIVLKAAEQMKTGEGQGGGGEQGGGESGGGQEDGQGQEEGGGGGS
ncbi:spore germination lipoprotein GerD [Aquibacillus albus]|uniref:Spore germination protein D n=1 Tax=Aquibacillus albus TaxID=1168171 RepID=A0ABS2N4H8_9BACI|nr:spore germination lipoprotein GerD [Aquibacillus albus]MBM7573054.1 spore germination protein D [Aquibacillus albus]